MSAQRLLRSLRSVAISCAVALACVSAVGCADMMTYSKNSRTEGIAMYNRGAYTDSAGAFRNAVRQNPRDYRSYYYLGAAQEQMGQFQESIAAYKTSYQVIASTMEGKQDPDFRIRALNGLASAIAKSDTREVEINAIDHRAKTHAFADDFYLLGKIYALRGDADGAMESLVRAATIEPENLHYAREAGLYLEQLGQAPQAVPMLRRAYTLSGGKDEPVAAALRRLGVVPGPSLKDESKLAKPIVPKGPIPAIELPAQGTVAGTPGGEQIRD